MKIYCDGSLVQNSDCAICIAIEGKKPQIRTLKNKRTTFELEYLAIIWACEHSKSGDLILSDNQKIVYRLNNNNFDDFHKIYFEKATELIQEKSLKIKWIPRDKNLAGKVLDNRVEGLRKYLGMKSREELKQKRRNKFQRKKKKT